MKDKRAELFQVIRDNLLSKNEKIYLYFNGYKNIKGELRVNNRPFIYADNNLKKMFEEIAENKATILSNLNTPYRVGWENSFNRVRDEIRFGKKGLLRLNQVAMVIFGPKYDATRSSQSYNVYTTLYFKESDIYSIIDENKLSAFEKDKKIFNGNVFHTIDSVAQSIRKYIVDDERLINKNFETDTVDEFPRVKRIEVSNLMNLNDISIDFSSGINLIIGENNVGKTGLVKFIYANIKAYEEYYNAKGTSNERTFQDVLSRKMQKTFQADDKIGAIVYKSDNKENNTLRNKIVFNIANNEESSIVFSITRGVRTDIKGIRVSNEMYSQDTLEKYNTVFIPAKEILSIADAIKVALNYSVDGFGAIYEDLLKDIEPLFAKNPDDDLEKIAKDFERDILSGKIVYDNSKSKYYYYNEKDKHKYNLTMSAEGIKQLGIIPLLIKTGRIKKGTILFLDEPDNNLHPVAIQRLVYALFKLVKVGIQIFITTHNHLLSQYVSLLSDYENEKMSIPESRFFSLYKDKNGKTSIEYGKDLLDISRNAILDEHVKLHDKEQGMSPVYEN